MISLMRGDRLEICGSIGIDITDIIPLKKKYIDIPEKVLENCKDMVDKCIYDMSQYVVPELRKLGLDIRGVDLSLTERG